MESENIKTSEPSGGVQRAPLVSILPFIKDRSFYELALLKLAYSVLIVRNRLFLALKDVKIETLDEYIDYVYNPDNIVFFAFLGGRMAGMGWINSHGRPGVGYCHICLASREETKGEVIAIGKAFLSEAFSLEYQGTPIYKVLISKSKKEQKHVRNYTKALGFQDVGIIPFTADDNTDCHYSYIVNPKAEELRNWKT